MFFTYQFYQTIIFRGYVDNNSKVVSLPNFFKIFFLRFFNSKAFSFQINKYV